MMITSDRGARLRALALSFSTAAVAALALSGCGGGGGSGSPAPAPVPGPAPGPAPTYTVGGSVAGLTTTGLALSDGTNTLVIDATATSFVFPGDLASGAAYNVTVAAQPSPRTQTCAVTGGSGTIANANAAVAVDCHATQWDLTTISGGSHDYAAPYVDGSPTDSTFLFTLGRGDVVKGPDGNFYVADSADGVVRRIAPDGTSSTYAGVYQPGFNKVAVDGPAASAKFQGPGGLAFGADGSLYVSDETAIRKISADGSTVSTLSGSLTLFGLADGDKDAARFGGAKGMRLGPDGNLYVADLGAHGDYTIRKVAPDGSVVTFAGGSVSGTDDGTGTAATLMLPQTLAIDGAGNVFVGDENAIRKITPAGVVTTLVANADYADAQGCLSDVPDVDHPLCSTHGMAIDAAGYLYVSDEFMRRVQMVAPDGTITTLFTGSPSQIFAPTGILIDSDGSLVIASTDSVKGLRDAIVRLNAH